MTPHGSWLVRVAILFVTALLPISLLAPPGAEAATPAQRKYANQAVKVTNNKRVQHDLVRLRKKDCVKRFATRQAKRMAAQRRMFHQNLSPILNRCNLSMVGENVAYGFPTGRAVVNAWMRSPGHRANILRARYRVIGIAARKGSNGYWYVSQVLGRKA
jgi:uncharacterized protein YkwD